MTNRERREKGILYITDDAIMEEQAVRGSAAKYAAFLEERPGKRKSVLGKIFGLLP